MDHEDEKKLHFYAEQYGISLGLVKEIYQLGAIRGRSVPDFFALLRSSSHRDHVGGSLVVDLDKAEEIMECAMKWAEEIERAR